MYKHILIPTDGSVLSEVAVRQGVALAQSLGARTTAITVTPTFRTLAAELPSARGCCGITRRTGVSAGTKSGITEDSPLRKSVARHSPKP